MRRLRARGLDFSAIRAEFSVTADFPADALAEAEAAKDSHSEGRADRTGLPLVTLDPPGARDLDQAMLLERAGDGYRVYYAIADVPAVVIPGGRLDAAARARGMTLYLPDGSLPLHPRVLSEGFASLLPGQLRPAVLWEITLDASGEPTEILANRALVRSRAQLNYPAAQSDHESGRLHPSIALLPEIGRLLAAAAAARGAIELRLPAQEVTADGESFELRSSPRTDMDGFNAQISLLAGRCAARLMLAAGVGILRTLPPADDATVAAVFSAARALGIAGGDTAGGHDPAGGVGNLLANLPEGEPTTLAMMSEATTLLRGADYAPLDDAGGLPRPAVISHAGLAAPYAHVTAPLRRLVDRFGLEAAVAISAGKEVPGWVREAVPELPGLMSAAGRLAGRVERACIDLTEASLLAGRVGEVLPAVVLREAAGLRPAEIYLASPPIIGACLGNPPGGSAITVRLSRADVANRTVEFEYLAAGA